MEAVPAESMETYYGYVRTPADAIRLFEACRIGVLPRVQRRLSEKERQSIRSGSVFVWDEREAGMRRWTDGKSWSASRVSGSFLTYREMEGKRGGGFGTGRRGGKDGRLTDEEAEDGEPEGYRYKTDGLMKQSFSITTSGGAHLHLISYFSRHAPDLLQPGSDPKLMGVSPSRELYPETSMGEANQTPALTRTPMQQGYVVAHHRPYAPQYSQSHHWPLSPTTTPPFNAYSAQSYPPAGSAAHYQQPQPSYAPQPHAQPHAQPHYSYPRYYEAHSLPPLRRSPPAPKMASLPSHAFPGRLSPPHEPLPFREPREAPPALAAIDHHRGSLSRGPLPSLSVVVSGGGAPQVGAGTPPTRHASVSPPRTANPELPSMGGQRPSLSSILHHTPASSESGGASGHNSPRRGSVMSVDKLVSSDSESYRTVRMLDRKFCI
ncbi:camp independent regulatory protein [Cordyceps fumosorosea ARSEF 2679]|uniref:Camp independent regulatory protein n=1 Tax=Cordyceps fumosorosea (strain ARSEF 2679) TaxID=1081104 RepID=A0A167YAB6_CORFA|nr:camp independent regulatory protein [Cordyceps fumosorosea ARSEF 2679]OAA66061.1 camp independent regulatory protein [Cordyceps fumosorosea ARSEF 2679]